MRKFAIRRALDPTMTRDEVDAGALQSLFNLSAINVPIEEAFDPRLSRDSELEWVRSYWQEGGDWGLCLYTARTESELALYHTACALPYVSFTAVDELWSPDSTDPTSGRAVVPPGAVLFTLEGALAATAPVEPGPGDVESFLRRLDYGGVVTPGEAGTRWVRAYVDTESRVVIGTFLAHDERTYLAIAGRAQDTGVIIRRVIEVTPSEYLDR
ncbi:MAG TPA: hypothetical protein VFK32_10535 [Tepidiformaceae bacterium]|nr:hypothetical protein [Tepidiformaceae bacterium]